VKMKNKKAIQQEKKEQHLALMKAQRRKEPVLSRAAPELDEKPAILIVCEGKNTEPSYFNQFRITSATVKSVGAGCNTISLVERAIQLSEQRKYDQVWCVFDKDNFPDANFNNAIKLANKNNFGIAYSNQAFEYWLILHFNDHQGGGVNRKNYNQMLNDLINLFNVKYDGNGSKIIEEDFFELLDGVDSKKEKKRVELAITRAERNYNTFDHLNPAKEESSTTVYLLVRELLKYI
jgi:hypothetical protein